MSTDTEEFWAGTFGDEYLQRNQVDWQVRVPFYRKVVQLTMARSVLEVGCNAGWNLRALHRADATLELAGCDINRGALDEAKAVLPPADLDLCRAGEIDGFYCDYDLVLTAGLLIHLPPDEIRHVMQSIAGLANDWVLAIEYAADREIEVDYRGHAGRLWRRPYGEMYAALGLKLEFSTELGPVHGFGEGCTAWLMRKTT